MNGGRHPRPSGVIAPDQDLNDIPEATVLSGPPTGGNSHASTSHQSTIPAAQMAYTIAQPTHPPSHPTAPSPMVMYPTQGGGYPPRQGPVVVDDSVMAQYLAQQGGSVPPPPPGGGSCDERRFITYQAQQSDAPSGAWRDHVIFYFLSSPPFAPPPSLPTVRLLYGRGQYLHAYLASRRTRALALLSIFTGSSLLIMYFLMSRRRGKAAGALGHDG
ncbi:hypothetical protein Naga_101345g1 [Nannochloropsis gaditana]|uniref:Uncharacterized protein n=1 Tax=Nannochloropsis gaditana TaxID=72520 RepID=W7TCL4_9STRA|nr:hypothetical protein Naga_101345g1 [Nannochloropsis gaditana]